MMSDVLPTRSDLKARTTQMKYDNNDKEDQALRVPDARLSNIPPVKSNIKAFSSQIKLESNKERQSLDSTDAGPSNMSPAKFEIKTPASQIKSGNSNSQIVNGYVFISLLQKSRKSQ